MSFLDREQCWIHLFENRSKEGQEDENRKRFDEGKLHLHWNADCECNASQTQFDQVKDKDTFAGSVVLFGVVVNKLVIIARHFESQRYFDLAIRIGYPQLVVIAFESFRITNADFAGTLDLVVFKSRRSSTNLWTKSRAMYSLFDIEEFKFRMGNGNLDLSWIYVSWIRKAYLDDVLVFDFPNWSNL